MIQFPCPSCAALQSAPEEAAGRATHCHACRRPLTVPGSRRRLAVAADLCWVILAVGTAGVFLLGLLVLGRPSPGSGPLSLEAPVAQIRDLVHCCLLVLSGYVVCRALDRLYR